MVIELLGSGFRTSDEFTWEDVSQDMGLPSVGDSAPVHSWNGELPGRLGQSLGLSLSHRTSGSFSELLESGGILYSPAQIELGPQGLPWTFYPDCFQWMRRQGLLSFTWSLPQMGQGELFAYHDLVCFLPGQPISHLFTNLLFFHLTFIFSLWLLKLPEDNWLFVNHHLVGF